jgi:para-aminobenzoate synthetase component I
MREINFSADELVNILLNLEPSHELCMLDSCGVSYLDSHLMIAGINPLETIEITEEDPEKTLAILNSKLSEPNLTAMLTISYNFGLKLNKITSRPKEFTTFDEPDIFIALFDALIIHDYNTQKSYLTGKTEKFDAIEKILGDSPKHLSNSDAAHSKISSNFTRQEYLKSVEIVQEFIKRGDTYQTNLTQQIRAELPSNLKAENIFFTLRKNYPAPFSALIRRKNDIVISASPERFFKVQNEIGKTQHSALSTQHSKISVSPIKGTRPRGKNVEEDLNLRNELLNSEKDRAENVMIVDLLRNDIGRICEYGSVKVEKLCDIEAHPTLYHLVSTVSGKLRENIELSDILRAVFPCGSITGAPKIRTMQIIDELETVSRGLSMGAIGIVQNAKYKMQNAFVENIDKWSMINDKCLMDFSVAIRTMTIHDNQAVFNVGGGITIDSVPEDEYAETLVKAKALVESMSGDLAL